MSANQCQQSRRFSAGAEPLEKNEPNDSSEFDEKGWSLTPNPNRTASGTIGLSSGTTRAGALIRRPRSDILISFVSHSPENRPRTADSPWRSRPKIRAGVPFMLRRRFRGDFTPRVAPILLVLLTPPVPCRARGGVRQGSLHEVRVPHPDARRGQALHVGLRPQGHEPALSDPADADALQRASPTASTPTRRTSGRRPLFGKEGYIFVYQDVRGRWMSEGEFVNMRPHRDQKDGPTDIDESTDTYDTIDWLIKNVPEPQRHGSACGGSRTPASTRRPA